MNFITRIFVDVKEQFKHDINNCPWTVVWEGVGTIASLIACTTLAILNSTANLYFVFAFYLIGSLGLLVGAKLRNNSFYILLSCGYTVINIYALINLFVQ